MIMAVFWLFLYIFVNLTSILYLGTIAINSLTGGENFHWIMIGLAVFALVITLGGMKVIGYTDVIQVLVLLAGGLITSYIALTVVSEKFGYGKDFLAGFNHLLKTVPEHFKMIIPKPTALSDQNDINKYLTFPGLLSYLAGIWIINLNYWGCNQYITQRALGADLKTARSGILFAAFLKLLIPIIAVLPGIAMYVLHQEGMFQQEMMDENGVVKPDHAYPILMNLLPVGLKGVAFAALTAAIVASLAGKANSISTIFSLDIYKKYIHKNASDRNVVVTGRYVVIISMVIAGLVAPALRTLDQAYQFIQEYVGFISPGVLAIFLMGLFWKRATSAAALTGALLTIPLSTLLKFLPSLTDGRFPDFPFLDRMTITFVIIVVIMLAMSLM
jgi:SSS family solute:Na+ symporter